ncbi:MAG: CopD family protein [Gemmatimonadota bacterium]
MGTAAGRALVFFGILLTVGAVFGRLRLIPGEAPSASPAGRAAARLGLFGSAAVGVGLAVLFAAQLSAFRDPFAPLGAEAALLLSTAWGRTWSGGGLAALLAAAGFAVAAAGRGVGWGTATLATLGLCFLPGLTGHAVATEGARTLAVLADALHVGAAGVWMGGLAAVLALDAPKAPGSDGALAHRVRVFSPWARGAVALLVATGLYASWLHVPGLWALTGSAYGVRLLLKLALVAGVAALGWWNWTRATHRLAAGGMAAVDARRVMFVELTLGLGVVVAFTAVLVQTAPP